MTWRCPFRPLPVIPLIALAVCALIACPGNSKGVATRGPGGGNVGIGSSAGEEIVGDEQQIHLERSHPSDDGVVFNDDKIPDDEAIAASVLGKEAITKGVRERYAGLRQCYENLALAHPGLAGKLMVKFTIGIDGTVTEASAKGVHPDLEACVEGEIRKMKFARPGGTGSVQVSYPFTFSP